MRGEFVSVWEDTYREIWNPLVGQEGVPDDVFSQLCRELATALREPSGEEALAIALNDAIQLRQVFDRALALAGVEIELARVDEAFVASGATSLDAPLQRRAAAEASLAVLIDDPAEGVRLLALALSELADDPERRAEAKDRTLDGIVNDTVRSREAFERVRSRELIGERALVAFLETAFEILEDLGGDPLANSYFNLLTSFIEKFSLRYDLRRPCTLCPTLPGVFASLVRDLRALTNQDPHLDALMKDFENGVRDLRFGCTDGRIRTCLGKQFMLLEALGSIAPGVTKDTLGGMCDELASWPHAAVKESLKKLYGFASDYPGIRHGKNAGGKLRDIDMRDMVAMSILLAGFTPYLSNELNPDVVYRGA